MEAVRIALSGVARARGNFGKTVVAQMLCGSKSSKMSKWRLDRLSTFGLLRDLRQAEVAELLDALIDGGMVQQSDIDRYRPVVELTAYGSEVMRGGDACKPPSLPRALRYRLEVRPPLSTPQRREQSKRPADSTQAATKSAAVSPGPAFEAPPAYDPFEHGFAEYDFPEHNLLDQQVAKQGSHARRSHEHGISEPPTSEQEAGDRKRLRHDEAAPAKNSPQDERPQRNGSPVSATRRDQQTPPGPQPEHYWTWRLLVEGYSLEQVAAVRRLTAVQVLDHALRAIDEGYALEAAWLLTPPQLTALEKAIGTNRPKHIRSLVENLPAGVTHQHVQLYLKCGPASSRSST